MRKHSIFCPNGWDRLEVRITPSAVGHAPAEILRHLDSCGIAVRAGDLAALPLLKRFGVNAAVRASCYLYTETAELDRLAAALHELAHTTREDS